MSQDSQQVAANTLRHYAEELRQAHQQLVNDWCQVDRLHRRVLKMIEAQQ